MSQEDNLKALWAQANPQATRYYQQVEPHLERWARQHSHDLLARLRRYFGYEMLAGVLGFVVLLWLLPPSHHAYPLWVGLMVAVLAVSGVWYVRLLRRMRHLHSRPVVEAVAGRIGILSGFLRHVRALNLLATPLAAAYGMYRALMEADTSVDLSWSHLGPRLLLILSLVILLVWLIDRFYIRKVYMPVLRRYRELYQRLTEKGSED